MYILIHQLNICCGFTNELSQNECFFFQVSTHMKLSEHGCMPKLVDYLRVNEDDELLEIIGNT